VPGFELTRAGAILAVSDFERSLAFYRDLLGLEVEALYDEPPTRRSSRPAPGSRLPSRVIRRRTVRE
jgi:hypothetical protein